MVGPDLGIVDVVVLIGEVVADHVVDLLLHEGTDVIEHGLLLFAHYIINIIGKSNHLEISCRSR